MSQSYPEVFFQRSHAVFAANVESGSLLLKELHLGSPLASKAYLKNVVSKKLQLTPIFVSLEVLFKRFLRLYVDV